MSERDPYRPGDASAPGPTGDPSPTEVVRTPAPGGSPAQPPVPPAPAAAGPAADRPIVEWDRANGDASGAATATVASPRRSNVTRWGIALVVVAIAIGLTAAAMMFAGASSQPEAYDYVPENSVAVFEIRPDLPGDQRQKLGNLLSRFPGFADQANLEEKIDEALSRLVREASDGEVDYGEDVEPFLEGPILLVGTDLGDGRGTDERFLLVATSTDADRCTERFGDATRTERHRDRDITIHTKDGAQLACVVVDRQILVGDLDSVTDALDAKADGRNITDRDGFAAAGRSFDQDQVAYGFVDLRTTFRQMEEAGEETVGLSPDQLPPWMAFSVRVEDDAVLVDWAAPDPSKIDGASPTPSPLRTLPPDKVSTLAPMLPDSTVAVVEARGLGALILTALDAAKADPEMAQQLAEIEQAALLLGGLDGLVGWMDDAAVVITADGTEIGGGLVIEATDVDAARQRLDQLKSLFLLAGGSAGVTVRDVPYGEATITVIDLGDLSDLLDLAGEELPVPTEADARIQIAYAIHGGLVAFGAGDEFVKTVIDTESGSTLADQSAYKRTIDRAGATNSGQVYVDVSRLLAAAEAQLEGDEAEHYRTEVKPYVEPFDGMAFVGRTDGDLIQGRMVITVR